jgi:hypothetical protein
LTKITKAYRGAYGVDGVIMNIGMEDTPGAGSRIASVRKLTMPTNNFDHWIGSVLEKTSKDFQKIWSSKYICEKQQKKRGKTEET